MKRPWPIDALREFLDVILELSNQKAITAKKSGVRRALEIFADELEELKSEGENESFFELLLDVQIDTDDTSAQLRRKIYALRYQAIRKDQLCQAEIFHKINTVRERVLAAVTTNRKPTYFESAFQFVLKEEIGGELDRTRLDKLFASPQDGYFRETTRRSSALETTKLKVKREIAQIRTLARELQVDFRACKRQEILCRGKVARELRWSVDWSQAKLSTRIKALFPDTPASQSTISRIENNVKLVDISYAKELATVFKVDAVLFLPTYFLD